jgi:predicted small integral membrane protein
MAYPSLALAVSTLALLTGLCTRSDFKSAISKAFSAVFIAGFTSDKLFVKILTAVTYLTLALLGVLAVYVFSAPWIECVLLHIAYQT